MNDDRQKSAMRARELKHISRRELLKLTPVLVSRRADPAAVQRRAVENRTQLDGSRGSSFFQS